MTYDSEFYEQIRRGCKASAAHVVPRLVKAVDKSEGSVIDVGCGEGWWGITFEQHGFTAKGCDGPWVEQPVISDFTVRNLETDSLNMGTADVAVCLEVAEHLTEERAKVLIGELCEAADFVLFSAAIPGQTGAGHINCQWQSYWGDLFEAQGFGLNDGIRWNLWNNSEVEPWYRQNMFVASRYLPVGEVKLADVVHPDIWGWFH